MNIKNLSIKTLFIVVFALIVSSCTGGGGSSITVTITPSNGALDQSVTVIVTAVFSDAITVPADWKNVFTLKLNNEGESVCTEVTYDEDSLTATCVHNNLNSVSNYTATISGINNVSETSATFTVGLANVISFSKTSVTTATDGDGEINIMFNFDAVLPVSADLEISVNNDATAGDCVVSDDKLSATCSVTKLQGCKTFQDYTVTLSGDDIKEDYSMTFNSADDEFNSSNTLTGCWYKARDEMISPTISDGNMNISLNGSSVGFEQNSVEVKDVVGVGEISILTYTSSLNLPSSEESNKKASFETHFGDQNSDFLKLWNGYFAGLGNALLFTLSYEQFAKPKTGGDLESFNINQAPTYECMVFKNGHVKTYLSNNGVDFLNVTSSDLECVNGSCVDPSGITNAEIPLPPYIAIGGSNDITGTTMTGSFGYFRVKSSGITGESSEDCPTLSVE